MKKCTVSILVLFIIAVFTTSAQGNKKLNPVGTWKFEAPYAPEGFTTGTIIVAMQEKTPTTSISFTGNEYKIPGEKVKIEGDSLKFDVYVEGAVVGISLKMESDTLMKGNAMSPDGEIPLTLKRDPEKK
ncbi:MAG TPA: hypothetical protein VHO46_05885 [Bacteroidales bacterium]|nr:hypothetical protein [Bacteroidales bacterium]